MKSVVQFGLSALLLGSIAVFGVIGLNSSVFGQAAGSQGPPIEIVTLVCQGSFGGFIVSGSASSANAPVVATSTNCAQALADVLNAGFKIADVQGSGSEVVYTLVN